MTYLIITRSVPKRTVPVPASTMPSASGRVDRCDVGTKAEPGQPDLLVRMETVGGAGHTWNDGGQKTNGYAEECSRTLRFPDTAITPNFADSAGLVQLIW